MPSKLRYLIKYISSTIYELISDFTTYESTFDTLDKYFIKKKNIIFANYLLETRRQSTTESIDEFLRGRYKLSKNC